MARISILHWTVDAHPRETADIHAARPTGGPEECGRIYCRDFAAARRTIYPSQFLDILESLAIPPTKETEVCETHEQSPGVHSYGGWFHAVGEIMEGEDDLTPLTEQFSMRISARRDVLPDVFGNSPVLQVDFYGLAPWVLSEPHEPPSTGAA
jgi:hypothetical protein